MHYQKLQDAIDSVGDPPCLGCANAVRCANGYACETFAHWVATGNIESKHGRIPQRKIYGRLYDR